MVSSRHLHGTRMPGLGRGPAGARAACFRCAASLAPLPGPKQGPPLRPRRSRAPPRCTAVGGPLLGSGQWVPWLALAACAGGGQFLEARTPLGRLTSAPLLSMVLGMCVSGLRLLPEGLAEYSVVWHFVMPLGACLFLLESNLSEIKDAGEVLVAFIYGAFGSFLGTVLAWMSVGHLLGSEGYKLAACLCASYIGGSINYAAVAQALAVQSGSLISAGMAADIVCMAIYLVFVMSWPAEDKSQSLAQGATSAGPKLAGGGVTSLTLISALVAACFACAVGDAVASTLGFPTWSLAFAALAASGLATLSTTAQQMGKSSTAAEGGTLFQGGEALGSALMLIFFAVIGVSSNLVGALSLGLNVVPFLLIQLTVHIVILVTLGRASGLSTQSMLIASNANIGGPATAAAMAATRGWGGMVQPALLTGSLGYAIGTSVGLATARILTNT